MERWQQNICPACKITSGWTQVKLDEFIDADLESSLLEIRTDSSLGGDDKVTVGFFNSWSSSAGGVTLHFTSTPQYELYKCTYSRTDFPANLPTEEEKVWTISLTKTSGTRLVIVCNEVEVLNILMSGSTCRNSNWNYYWKREVEKIRFDSLDSASDYYRLRGKGMIYHGTSYKLSSLNQYNHRTINVSYVKT